MTNGSGDEAELPNVCVLTNRTPGRSVEHIRCTTISFGWAKCHRILGLKKLSDMQKKHTHVLFD